MGDTKPRDLLSSALPPRNFSVALEDRVRALAGPPAYMRRKRQIEDLEEQILRMLVALLVEESRAGLANPAAIDASVLSRAPHHLLERMNELVTRHNRYYPSEANLPLHPRTGAMLENGHPWQPLELWTMHGLLERARAR